MIAERCLSASHDAHASVCSMGQGMAMDQAAGTAVAMAAGAVSHHGCCRVHHCRSGSGTMGRCSAAQPPDDSAPHPPSQLRHLAGMLSSLVRR
ncbi:MAG: hypothetical protein HXY39_08235 [Chloroflexi bacterium]|nr:hypothetical protein [Chloroflexota bacterium]